MAEDTPKFKSKSELMQERRRMLAGGDEAMSLTPQEEQRRKTKKETSPTFNITSRLEQIGAQQGVDMEMTGYNPVTGEADVRVTSGDVEENRKFNAREFLAKDPEVKAALDAQGLSPEDVNLEINTPEQALKVSALPFARQVDYARIPTETERKKYLENTYGKENVKVMPPSEKGQKPKFVVKDYDGAWKEANSGIGAAIASSTPYMVAGGIGSVKGAAVGAQVGMLMGGPVGAAIGGTVGFIGGSALGAGLAKVTDIKTAEMMGIRSEQDFEDVKTEVAKEMGNDLIWTIALGGAGKLAKTVGRKGAQTLHLDRIAEDWAGFLADLTNAPRQHFRRVLDPKSSKRVLAATRRSARHMDDMSTAKGLDPNLNRQFNLLRNTYQEAKDVVSKDFENMKTLLRESGTLSKARTNVEDLAVQVDEIDTLLKQNDGALTSIMTKENMADVSEALTYLRNKGLSMAGRRKPIEAVGGLTRDVKMSFTDLLEARRKVDAVLADTGVYRKGDMESLEQARRPLMALRNQISTKIHNSLKGVTVKVDGQTKAAGEIYSEANKKYKDFRDLYDYYNVPKKISDETKATTFVSQLFGNKGDALQARIGKLQGIVGDKGKTSLDEIANLEAGRQLAAAKGKGASSGFFGGLIQGPFKTPRMATVKKGGLKASERQFQRPSSPALAYNNAIEGVKKIGQQHVNVINKLGQLTHFMKVMTPQQFNDFVKTPALYRPVLESTYNAISGEESAARELTGTAVRNAQQRQEEMMYLLRDQQQQSQGGHR